MNQSINGELLRDLRGESGMSAEDAASAAGLPGGASQWLGAEDGQSDSLTIASLISIAVLLKVDARKLITPLHDYERILDYGFHEMDLAKVKSLCVTAFPKSSSREKIFADFESAVLSLEGEGIPATIWAGGSFFTMKPEPNDIDIVIWVDKKFEGSDPQRLAISRLEFMPKSETHCHGKVERARPIDDRDKPNFQKWRYGYWLRQLGFNRLERMKGIAVIKTNGGCPANCFP